MIPPDLCCSRRFGAMMPTPCAARRLRGRAAGRSSSTGRSAYLLLSAVFFFFCRQESSTVSDFPS